jgi:hypothetical protein
MASMRNLTIAALRADGWTNIAAGLRWAGRNYLNPLSLLSLFHPGRATSRPRSGWTTCQEDGWRASAFNQVVDSLGVRA